MDPLKEALTLLDQSLERLENGIIRIKDKNTTLLAHSIKQKNQLMDLEEKRQKALQELYTLRDMIGQELHIEVEKKIVHKKQTRTPSIFMTNKED